MANAEGDGKRILDAAVELAPKIRASADEIEQGRRLPMHLVQEMKRAGLFRVAMPKAWDGPELDFPTQLRVIETLSAADASVGWCIMIGRRRRLHDRLYRSNRRARNVSGFGFPDRHYVLSTGQSRQDEGWFPREWPMALRQRLPTRDVDDRTFRTLRGRLTDCPAQRHARNSIRFPTTARMRDP